MPLGRRSALLFLVPLLAGAGALPALDPTQEAAIERIVSGYMSRAGIPGLSLAIARDGAGRATTIRRRSSRAGRRDTAAPREAAW